MPDAILCPLDSMGEIQESCENKCCFVCLYNHSKNLEDTAKRRLIWLLKGIGRELRDKTCPRFNGSRQFGPVCYRYAVFIDAAGFKAINDRFGEAVGDGILGHLGDFISKTADEWEIDEDFSYTNCPLDSQWCGICFGGDEYAIIAAVKNAENCFPSARAAQNVTNCMGGDLGTQTTDALLDSGGFTADGTPLPALRRLPRLDRGAVNCVSVKVRELKERFADEVMGIHLYKDDDGEMKVTLSDKPDYTMDTKIPIFEDKLNAAYYIRGVKLHASHGDTLEEAGKNVKVSDEPNPGDAPEEPRGRFSRGFQMYCYTVCEAAGGEEVFFVDLNENVAFFAYIDPDKYQSAEMPSHFDAVAADVKNILAEKNVPEENIEIRRVSSTVKRHVIFIVTIRDSEPADDNKQKMLKADRLVDNTKIFSELLVNNNIFTDVFRLDGTEVIRG